MNAPAQPKAWNHDSWARKCGSCDGDGRVSGYEGTYGTHYCRGPYDRACSDCDETGVIPCPVCGSKIVTEGYDCIVCSLVDELPDGVDEAELFVSVANALKAKGSAQGEQQ